MNSIAEEARSPSDARLAGVSRAQGRSAREIPVRQLRQTLFWPLAFNPPCGEAGEFMAKLEGQVETLEKQAGPGLGWERIFDPLEHLPADTPEQRQAAYAEFVYFHAFIQDFLFGKQSRAFVRQPSGERRFLEPFYLYRRTDFSHLDVAFDVDGRPRSARFTVDRCLLYVFRTGVAILAVDLSIAPSNAAPVGASLGGLPGVCVNDALRLSDAQTLMDLVRRAYCPYFRPGPAVPDLVVTHACWRREDGGFSPVCDMRESALHVDQIAAGGELRATPVFAHWMQLLPEGWTVGAAQPGKPVWRHIVDERMPLLAVVSIGECDGSDEKNRAWYDAIRRDDLVRLCFIDMEESSAYPGPPSDPVVLGDFERDNCYRRFENSGALYLVSGYGFVQLLAGSGFSDGVLAVHARRHYYQIMLLAQFELASLLGYSSRISRLVGEHDDAMAGRDPQAGEQLARRMRDLQAEMMDFLHRFRFTGVTNQLQGQELNDLLRRRLRLDAIYRDLRDEIDSGNALLAREAQERETAAASNLSVVATFGLTASVATSLLGMNVFFGENLLKDIATGGDVRDVLPVHAMVVASVVAAVFGLASALIGWSSRERDKSAGKTGDPRLASIAGKLRWIAVAAAVVAFVFMMGASWRSAPAAKADAQTAQPAAAKP